jgi:hypothetical protein
MYIIFLRAEILGLDFAKVFTMIGFKGTVAWDGFLA